MKLSNKEAKSGFERIRKFFLCDLHERTNTSQGVAGALVVSDSSGTKHVLSLGHSGAWEGKLS